VLTDRFGKAVLAMLVVSMAFASIALSSRLPAPRAFSRVAETADAVPGWLRGPLVDRQGEIADSRRIATYSDGRGRKASLYLVQTSRQWTCLLSVGLGGGGGGGCSPSNSFMAAKSYLSVGENGRLVTGVVRANVTHVVIVGSRGVLHPLQVTRDGGFIYDCHAYNGCTHAVVRAVRVYNARGQLLQVQSLP
jgi:hypothetical protein